MNVEYKFEQNTNLNVENKLEWRIHKITKLNFGGYLTPYLPTHRKLLIVRNQYACQ
jgi:hypothetical protein